MSLNLGSDVCRGRESLTRVPDKDSSSLLLSSCQSSQSPRGTNSVEYLQQRGRGSARAPQAMATPVHLSKGYERRASPGHTTGGNEPVSVRMNFEDFPPKSVNLMFSQDRKDPAVAVHTSWVRRWGFRSEWLWKEFTKSSPQKNNKTWENCQREK